MKKILISLAALSLVLSACGSETKVEKKVVKQYEKFAKENDIELLMTYSGDSKRTATMNEYLKHIDQDELDYTTLIEYALYDKDGEALVYIAITEYKEKVDKEETSKPACIIDKTVVSYVDAYDVDFDGANDAQKVLKNVCDDLDGLHIKESE